MRIFGGLLFLAVTMADTTEQENESPSGEVEMKFPEPTTPLVLHKDKKLLDDNNGSILIIFQTNEKYDEETGISTNKALQVEMVIENEEKGKLYSDLEFNDWSSHHQTEIVGEQPGKAHKFLIDRSSLYFRYNETAPNFTLTLTEIPALEGDCQCGGWEYQYPEGISDSTRHPTAILTLQFPKNCSKIACGWHSEYDMKLNQEIEFSFLGIYDKNDRFYVRTTNGTTSLLPDSKSFKRFKILVTEPFIIYFIGSENPVKDRHMNLEYTYETQE